MAANRRHYRNPLYRRAYRSDSHGNGRKSGKPCRAKSQKSLPKISLTCHYCSTTSSPSTDLSAPLILPPAATISSLAVWHPNAVDFHRVARSKRYRSLSPLGERGIYLCLLCG